MTDRLTILGIPFDRVTLDGALERVADAIQTRRFCQIVTPGPEFLMRAQHDPQFRSVLQRAELSLPDGAGVVLAARMLGLPRLERVTGNDLLDAVLKQAAAERWRVFFFGSLRPGAVELAARRAVRRYPGVDIVGAESGFRGDARVPDAEVCRRIRRSRADVLFVALGAPEQELWIARHRHELGRVVVAAGIGGAIDYLSGVVRRAPPAVRAIGLEWFLRLLAQPRRRYRRIVTAVWEFPLAVLRERYDHV